MIRLAAALAGELAAACARLRSMPETRYEGIALDAQTVGRTPSWRARATSTSCTIAIAAGAL